MPRPSQRYAEPHVPRRSEPLPEMDRPRYCTCPKWPCDPANCLPCPACQRHGRPLFTRAERLYIKTGKGLPKETIEELRKLSQPHGPNSRAARQRATEEEGAA